MPSTKESRGELIINNQQSTEHYAKFFANHFGSNDMGIMGKEVNHQSNG